MNLTSINYKTILLTTLILGLILPKWLLGFFSYNLSDNINLLINFDDAQYFPLIFNLSNFSFGESYIDYFDNVENFAVLLTPLLFHAIFYKFGGVVGIIFIEVIYQLILITLLFKVIQKIFGSYQISFLFCFVIFGLRIIIQYLDSSYLTLLIGQIEGIFGSRVPRPIFSSIFLFLFFYQILDFKKQLAINFQYKYLLILSFSFGMLINSFLYYFLNCFILLCLLFFLIKKKSSLIFIFNNFKKLVFFLLSLFIFIAPFIIQYALKEEDHAIRMGLFSINFEQKLFFFKNYIYSLIRPEVISVILISTIFYLLSNFKKRYERIFDLNIFFYFFISSLISPILFVLFSNKIISIHHFILITKFAGFFYLLLIFIYFCIHKLDLKNYTNFISNNKFITLILIFLIYLNFENNNFNLGSKQKTIQDYTKIEQYLKKNKLNNTELKLFSNDSGVNNLWLIYNNKKLLLSDGWINSLKDKDIEYLLFNSLKIFGVDQREFEKFLLFNNRLSRTPLFLFLFNYKYQANSLRTFSKIDDYDTESQEIIKKTSFFRAQEQIVPESEKKRMKNSFTKHLVNQNLEPDIVIIYESTFPFSIINKKYIRFKKYNNLVIYKKNDV